MKKQLSHDKKNSNPAHTKMQNIIASTIIIGVILSVTVMVIAMAIYLYTHNGPAPIKHIYNGEPKQLEKIMLIIKAGLSGNILSILQIGIILLLVNPIIRIAMILYCFIIEKNKLYITVSGIVLIILCLSFLY
jgi:uncharacterized membrane protein